MAVQRFKVSLNAARFPLVSTKGQRAVYVPGLDSTLRVGESYAGSNESVDTNRAQVLYGENFMPIAEGLKSVGYSELIAATANEDFDQIFALRDDQENTVLYSPAAGKNYVYDGAFGIWTSTAYTTIWSPHVPLAPYTPDLSKVTYAYVEGYTFVCFSRVKSSDITPVDMSIMYWNPTTQSLSPATALVTNLPFAAGEIDGIAASNGYLIVYSGITVAWAPFNGTAFDFTIYTAGNYTGAGYQIPEDVQGNIQACIGLPGGFVIFTTKNGIAASYYSQSVISPWVFRAIPNCGGIASYEQATIEGSLGYIIAYTTTGFQKISLNSAEEVHPDVSDFIVDRYLEQYSFGTQTLSRSTVNIDFYTKLSNVANRYLILSYGTQPTVFSFALVYDMSLKRWGKLRVVHCDCFYYSYGSESQAITYSMLGDSTYTDMGTTLYSETLGQSSQIVPAQHGLAFLAPTGQVQLATWSNQLRTEDNAVVVIGRVQLTRTSNIQFNRIELEGLNTGRIYVVPSYNGKDLEAASLLTTIEQTTDYRIAGDLIDCKNFNLIVEGTFDLSTGIIEATTAGRM